MKQHSIIFLYVILASVTCFAVNARAQTAPPSCPAKLSTAVDHLSVIEYDEPVVQVASGSKEFQIQWQDKKVFISPSRPGASTNLFVWTESNQYFCYELSVGALASMDAETHVTVLKPPRPANSEPGVQELADDEVIRTLLRVKSVSSAGLKPQKNAVAARIEEVYRVNGTLVLRYFVENRTSSPYVLRSPEVYRITPDHPSINLQALEGTQLDQLAIQKLGSGAQARLTALGEANDAANVPPGAHKEGVVAVHLEPIGSPSVLRLVFTANCEVTIVL